jgi:ribose transport system permease protein
VKPSARRISLGTDRFSGLYLLAAFIVVFGVWSPHVFMTVATVHLIASQQAVAGIVAIAVLIPLTSGNYDLSVGANANLTGILAIVLQTREGWGLLPTLVVSLGAGMMVGVVNGFIVVRLGVNSFITTLAMGSVLAAVQVIVTSSQQPQPVLTPLWNNLTQAKWLGFQVIVVYLLIIALLAWWLMDHTPLGRHLFAAGGNPEAARLSGVRVDRMTWFSLTSSATLAGVAGVLYTSLSGPSLSFGDTLLLPAFAAAFLGSTQLKPGRFNVGGTIVAIFVLAVGVQGLQIVSGQQWLSDMFNGVALILAVAMAVSRGRRSAGRFRKRRASVPRTSSDPARPADAVPPESGSETKAVTQGSWPA